MYQVFPLCYRHTKNWIVFLVSNGCSLSCYKPKIQSNLVRTSSVRHFSNHITISNSKHKPINLKKIKQNDYLVPVSSIHCCTYTSGLSSTQSTCCLNRDLILRRVSHLDAFSGYPFRTQLLGNAAGATTDTPQVRPTRSSRTKVSLSQISYAHGGQRPNCLTTF